MATIIAAGAASCAGYFIGTLALGSQKQPRPVRRVAPPHQAVRGGYSGYAHTPTTVTAATGWTLPTPKRCIPGQCMLCESWYQHGDVVAKLYCGHVFHRTCLETVCRQTVYENFRCTCRACRGLSWVTRFAVTELRVPVEPSVPPLHPLTPPVPPAAPKRDRVCVQLSRRRAVPVAKVRAAPPPPPPPTPPPPQDVVENNNNDEEDQVITVVPPAAPVTPFCLTGTPARNSGWPSCSLCACGDCAVGGDGNCITCGRCACYACTYSACECCCRCVVNFGKK
jgi:hypothetical protein